VNGGLSVITEGVDSMKGGRLVHWKSKKVKIDIFYIINYFFIDFFFFFFLSDKNTLGSKNSSAALRESTPFNLLISAHYSDCQETISYQFLKRTIKNMLIK
jgi:hypothetical protein